MNRQHLLAIACGFALSLAGCGVGVGGTGTGESGDVLADFGAAPVALCEAPFATRLECGPATQPGGPPPVTGTLQVLYADTATGRQVVASIAGNAIALDAPCVGLRFGGTWGAAPGGEAEFFGVVEWADGAAAVLARLRVTAGPGVDELEVELRSADARLLLGPLSLRRAAAPVSAGCT